ncbi:MAG: hypothetical protein U9R08_02385 [Nanoarchaeota archaeon]|nr:hypothetical protein [Nanoarchaeota archaeon]
MKKITRFVGKRITIDGVIGTIYQEQERGFCEFVNRDQIAIKTIKIASRYLKNNGERNYKIKDKFLDSVIASKETYGSLIAHWSGYYPCGNYLRRDQELKNAGI